MRRLSWAAPPMKVTGAVLSTLSGDRAAAVLLLTFPEQFSGKALYDYGWPAFFCAEVTEGFLLHCSRE